MQTGVYKKMPLSPYHVIDDQEIRDVKVLHYALEREYIIWMQDNPESEKLNVSCGNTLEKLEGLLKLRRLVFERVRHVMSTDPFGNIPEAPKGYVYVGEGPLHGMRRLHDDLHEGNQALILSYNRGLNQWSSTPRRGDSWLHYAVLVDSKYAEKYWPDHVAAYKKYRYTREAELDVKLKREAPHRHVTPEMVAKASDYSLNHTGPMCKQIANHINKTLGL